MAYMWRALLSCCSANTQYGRTLLAYGAARAGVARSGWRGADGVSLDAAAGGDGDRRRRRRVAFLKPSCFVAQTRQPAAAICATVPAAYRSMHMRHRRIIRRKTLPAGSKTVWDARLLPRRKTLLSLYISARPRRHRIRINNASSRRRTIAAIASIPWRATLIVLTPSR